MLKRKSRWTSNIKINQIRPYYVISSKYCRCLRFAKIVVAKDEKCHWKFKWGGLWGNEEEVWWVEARFWFNPPQAHSPSRAPNNTTCLLVFLYLCICVFVYLSLFIFCCVFSLVLHRLPVPRGHPTIQHNGARFHWKQRSPRFALERRNYPRRRSHVGHEAI